MTLFEVGEAPNQEHVHYCDVFGAAACEESHHTNTGLPILQQRYGMCKPLAQSRGNHGFSYPCVYDNL